MTADETPVAGEEPTVPSSLWRSSVILFIGHMLIGLGVLAALALGWRSPTPRRAPDSVWSWTGDGSATLTDNGYQLHLLQPNQRAWATAGQQVADFDLELNTRSLLSSEDVGYGLLYRYQNPANYYLFTVGGDGYYTIAVVQDSALTPLRVWQQWPHVRRGAAANRLRVRCEGEVCHFFINGESTATVVDDTFASGDLGLWAQTFSDDVLNVVFEDTLLWTLD